MGTLLTIGQVAETTGTTTTALRHYDDIGLLRPATRVGGQRRYGPEAVRRLRIVRDCQAAGFTLAEVRRLLDGQDHHWQELARRKRDELHERIQQLQEAARLVDEALACGCHHIESCDRADHGLPRGDR